MLKENKQIYNIQLTQAVKSYDTYRKFGYPFHSLGINISKENKCIAGMHQGWPYIFKIEKSF